MTDLQTVAQYRKFLNETSWYTHTDEGNAPELTYLTLGLAGESGEFADEVKKVIRVTGALDSAAFLRVMEGAGGKDKMIEELGDTLWYLVKLGDFLNISLDGLMVTNTYKLYNRLIEGGKFTKEEMPWPFTSPELSYEAVEERMTRVRFD